MTEYVFKRAKIALAKVSRLKCMKCKIWHFVVSNTDRSSFYNVTQTTSSDDKNRKYLLFLPPPPLTVTSPRAAPWRRFVWTATSLCHQCPGRWRWDETQCLALDLWQAVRNLWWSAQSHQVKSPSCMVSSNTTMAHSISGHYQHSTRKPGTRKIKKDGLTAQFLPLNSCFVCWQGVHQKASWSQGTRSSWLMMSQLVRHQGRGLLTLSGMTTH